MFEEVEARRRRLDTFRPFGPEVQGRLDAVFEPWFIYGSNAIEGNTLTLGDTIGLIREGRLPAGKTEAEYLEVKGQQAAYAYLRQAVVGRYPLSEKLVREFHQLLTGPLEAEKYHPGQYKDRDNQVRLADGGVFPYVSHVDTPAAMKDLVDWCNGPGQALHAIERAAHLHYKFILIHPFRDGSGRTARLLANLVLLQAGYVLTVFRAEERRRQYLDALRAVDLSVPLADLSPANTNLNLFPFVVHLEQELLWSYDLALEVLEGRLLLTTEDLVRRFERLDERALSAAGVASDESARLEVLAEAVKSLTARVNEAVSEAAYRLNGKWTELFFWFDTTRGASEEVLADNVRVLALGNGETRIRGQTGVVRASVRRARDSSAQLRVPENQLLLIAFAEAHRLIVASFRTLGPALDAQLAAEKVVLPLDASGWRQDLIEGFVANQLNLLLAGVEREIELANRPPAPP